MSKTLHRRGRTAAERDGAAGAYGEHGGCGSPAAYGTARLPRWTTSPVAGETAAAVGAGEGGGTGGAGGAGGTGDAEPSEAVLVLPPELWSAVENVAARWRTDAGSLLLAAHLRVVSALTGRREAAAGYVPWDGAGEPPRVVAMDLAPGSWRELAGAVAEAGRAAAVAEGAAGPAAPGPGPAGPAVPHDSVLTLSRPQAAHGPEAAQRVSRDGCALVVDAVGAVDAVGTDAPGAGVRLVARSRTDVMTVPHLERILGYHRRVLEQLTTAPEAPHHRVSLLSQEERDIQVHGLAGPQLPLGDRLFVELFEERVRADPAAVACSHRERSWTYAGLNAHANRIAHALLDGGLGAEDVVAVVMERGLEWVAAVLGVLKAGGAYMPVGPEFPTARILAQLDGADCRFVVVGGEAETVRGEDGAASYHGRPALRAVGCRAPAGAADHRACAADHRAADPCAAEHRAADPREADPGVRLRPGQLAYVYYTSGSTGSPKGAMCEHAGLLNHLMMKAEDLPLAAGDVVAQTAGPCVDISLWQTAAPLLVGGSTRIVDTATQLDVDRFLDEVTSAGVRVAQFVPSYFDALVSRLEQRPRVPGPLRTVSVTGEALKPELARRWFACCPGTRLVNAYGATELSDDTMHDVLDAPPEGSAVTVGRLRRNVYGYVLDEGGELAPLGSPGEIAFSGVGVGRGYVRDEERTRQAFVPDPFRPGARMYRTGDFGRWLPGGRMEFLGRRDQQVRIRGFRVETGEIENHLLAVDGVKDAVVVVDGAGDRHRVLVAFLVGRQPLSAESVAEELAGRLPEHLVPTYFHQLGALPVGESGKVDRRALTGLAGTLGHADGPYVAPGTAAERRLAMAWAEVLNVPLERIGRRSDFFDLGGSSLSATWLVIRLGGSVTLSEVLGHPVLADLAAVLEQDREREQGTGPETGPETGLETGPETVREESDDVPLAAGPAASAALPAAASGGRSGAAGRERPRPVPLLQPLSPAVRDGEAEGLLVCFPYAAGNAVNFQSLAAALAGTRIAVHAVELPAHDLRRSGETPADVDEVARRVRDELAGRTAAPLLLWGQREGAVHALASARLLEDEGAGARCVFLAGVPLDPRGVLRVWADRVAEMSDREAVAVLREAGAYVEFDGLKSERTALAARAYRHDVASTARHLLEAHRRPGAHRVAGAVDLVAPAGEGRADHGFWSALCADPAVRPLAGPLTAEQPVADPGPAPCRGPARGPGRAPRPVPAHDPGPEAAAQARESAAVAGPWGAGRLAGPQAAAAAGLVRAALVRAALP